MSLHRRSRRRRQARPVMLLALAAILAAAVASPAAAAPRLVLSENGVVVSPGDYASSYYLEFDGGCLQAAEGTVLTNDRRTDSLTLGPPVESECLEEGFAVSGSIRSVKLSSAGVATLKAGPKLTIAEPGPCVYAFSKLTGAFPAAIEVEIEGSATGKLVRRSSAPGCEPRREIAFRAVESGSDGDIFASEVVG